MNQKESMDASIIGGQDIALRNVDETLSPRGRDFHFAMGCNGYFLINEKWVFSPSGLGPIKNEFTGQAVSFFGPHGLGGDTYGMFESKDIGHDLCVRVFEQGEVVNAISRYREIDGDQAARMAYLFGGIVRHLKSRGNISDEAVAGAVGFAAHMTRLGEHRSGDAIASAVSMYIISGGLLEEDIRFFGDVYHMAKAIREDPIVSSETRDLGISQLARFRAFVDRIQGREAQPFVEVDQYREDFEEFPTVGAEFHFSPDDVERFPRFWQRLAILNMSQYQKGSYVQFSRNDQGVIEVRMNPSIYPITIANWNYMRFLLPELNQTYFTITLNRDTQNFQWGNKEDKALLTDLRAIGLLSYATVFKSDPYMGKKEQIDFGSTYLGQTVKVFNGNYDFSGHWGRKEGTSGQLAIYTGFGENFPYLAYYLSMALANPDILESLQFPRVKTLQEALDVLPDLRPAIFKAIQQRILKDERLNQAHEAGNRIMEQLSP